MDLKMEIDKGGILILHFSSDSTAVNCSIVVFLLLHLIVFYYQRGSVFVDSVDNLYDPW